MALTGLPAAGLALAAPAAAADGGVFFSEYVEGSSNNKALEIYNGTGAPVNLSGYNIQQYSNGSATAGSTFNLSGTVAAGDVFVFAHSGSAAEILAVADQTTGTGLFNGNDALVLRQGTQVLDVIGQIGFDPGVEWGSGLTSTADNTLRRKATITSGRTDGSTAFDPAVEWDGFPNNTFDGLGWHLTQPGGPGDEEPPVEEPIGADCGDPATRIHAVQGSGATSPLVGQRVAVEAVVTAVTPGLNGFYVQERPELQDADPLTSEGVFVFTGANTQGAAPGKLVRVLATVGEYSTTGASQTQLTQPTVVDCGTAAPIKATEVTFPLADAGDMERYEGMLVKLVDEMVISEYFEYDRFGEVVIAKPLPGQDRHWTPTAVADPGPDAQALAAEYAKRRITVDDRNGSQNPAVLPHPGNGEPFSLENRFRGGDTITGIEGVVDHTFGKYRIQPTTYGAYVAKNPRSTSAPDVGGTTSVASFNVLNYFLTIDRGGSANYVCGPNRNMECRGADNATELERQRAKIVAALAELDADVVGLMEMENTPGVEPAADLAAGLNDVLGAGTYSYIDTGVVGTDAIRLGYLYKPGNVTPVGDTAILDSSVDARFDDNRNRPMLTQTFDEVLTGERFTVSINHLKSKGSACGAADPDRGDGQGNCNLTRVAAANAIADFLATDPTGSGDPDHLVIGDLNSYDHEDPITALVNAGYTDLVKKFGGETAYGYVFDGQAGYLDHALANESLLPQVTGTSEWHINADEPDVLDYDISFKPPAQQALYAPDPFRSSDHDPVLIGLDLFSPTLEACYADGAQTVESYLPGKRKNGTNVPPGHARPHNALGLPDPESDQAYWTTLGLGGEITLRFSVPVRDGEGADLRIHDVVDGAKGAGDAARVLVSSDGQTWTDLGVVTGTGEVDLAAGGVSSAEYVKVVDVTPSGSGPAAIDGYDLDAVEVLSGCG